MCYFYRLYSLSVALKRLSIFFDANDTGARRRTCERHVSERHGCKLGSSLTSSRRSNVCRLVHIFLAVALSNASPRQTAVLIGLIRARYCYQISEADSGKLGQVARDRCRSHGSSKSSHLGQEILEDDEERIGNASRTGKGPAPARAGHCQLLHLCCPALRPTAP
jgi:hypothetical protein